MDTVPQEWQKRAKHNYSCACFVRGIRCPAEEGREMQTRL
jgi:hypothetical protein